LKYAGVDASKKSGGNLKNPRPFFFFMLGRHGEWQVAVIHAILLACGMSQPNNSTPARGNRLPFSLANIITEFFPWQFLEVNAIFIGMGTGVFKFSIPNWKKAAIILTELKPCCYEKPTGIFKNQRPAGGNYLGGRIAKRQKRPAWCQPASLFTQHKKTALPSAIFKGVTILRDHAQKPCR